MISVGFVLVSGEFGGAETMVHEVLSRLDRDAFDLSLFVNSVVADSFCDVDDLAVYDLGDLRYYSLRAAVGLDDAYARAQSVVEEGCAAEDVDLLVYHLPGSLFLSPRRADVREIYVMHGGVEFETGSRPARSDLQRPLTGSGLRRRLRRLCRRTVNGRNISKVDHVVLTCEYFVELLVAHGITVQRTVIPNGVDLSIRSGRDRVVESTATAVCYVGGARNVKGWDLLVRAVECLADEARSFDLYVLRDVPDGHAMRRFVAEHSLGEFVEFVGYVDRETYLDYLHSCDLLCLPSYSESIPVSALEALALGKPVVATDVGGTGEIVTHEQNGYLCRPTSESVAEGLSYFLDAPERIERVGERNWERATRYRWERVIEDYENCFHRVGGP